MAEEISSTLRVHEKTRTEGFTGASLQETCTEDSAGTSHQEPRPEVEGSRADGARRAARAALPLALQRLIIALSLFSAISALGGGVELLIWRAGNEFLPLQLLEHAPFETFLIPGLLLTLIVGGTSLACLVLVWRHSHAAVDATLLAGGALSIWIVAELAILRSFHWLHAVYGALGLAILGLGAWAAYRSPAPRHRWVLIVTLAEAFAFLVPASVGILSARADMGTLAQAGWLVSAGLVEGFVLGAGQAWALPLPVRRARYALLTALGAGIVWSGLMFLSVTLRSMTLPFVLLALMGALGGLLGLTAIGTAQWLELRHHARKAHRWIAWTALAWAVALPFSFAPGPFVDETTPFASHLVLWGSGGMLMAYVMALVTWQGVRHLLAKKPVKPGAETSTAAGYRSR